MSEKFGDGKPLSPGKLLIDNPSDFRFHAAYLAYADVYDKTTGSEARKQLNQNIVALQQNKIDYSTFYKNISKYRAGEGFQPRYGITFVKTQRKREWRKEMQKRERNKRHKK
ncbi:MAG: hypothetical protein QXM52_07020 [Candidatus Bathyarchaeia archaeon]